MPTNANTFNSRVTSEALEEKFRQVFPAQGGAELVQDLFASGVIQPVVDFSSVAEGSFLPEILQTAWDFATGAASVNNATTNLITNTGFWKVSTSFTLLPAPGAARNPRIELFDGATAKPIFGVTTDVVAVNEADVVITNEFVVFLRAGDVLRAVAPSTNETIDAFYRQIADVNGTLVNPLGFTF